SQSRSTRHPFSINVRVTSASRERFAPSFFCQKTWFCTGMLECFGQQCQKHPSTKTTRRSFRNVKSGLPKSGRCRRQPLMPFSRNSRAIAHSVFLLPRPRIRDITSERFAGENTSGIISRFHKSRPDVRAFPFPVEEGKL